MDPWSKVDYSWIIRRSILPPAGCREEVFWRSRSWKRGGGGTEARSRKRVLSSSVLGREVNIGEGGSQGAPGSAGGLPAWPHPRLRHLDAWTPSGSPRVP